MWAPEVGVGGNRGKGNPEVAVAHVHRRCATYPPPHIPDKLSQWETTSTSQAHLVHSCDACRGVAPASLAPEHMRDVLFCFAHSSTFSLNQCRRQDAGQDADRMHLWDVYTKGATASLAPPPRPPPHESGGFPSHTSHVISHRLNLTGTPGTLV